MKPIRFAALTLAGALLLTAGLPARAATYDTVVAERSAVTFTYQQMGVNMDGRFRRFTSKLAFDPARPANASATIDVELASIDAGSPDADQEVGGRTWFDTKSFPTARFTSSSVRPLGSNRYEISGKLAIKGHSRDIAFPASFTPAGTHGVFEGAFTIRRGDFAIGEGSWSKYDVVANDVQIRFRLAASGR